MTLCEFPNKKHSCSLCSHNLSFSNSITKYFGGRGVKNINLVQLLFTCCAIEKELEIEAPKKWFRINGSTCGKC